ncbi:DUF5683 domain-containing protein [Sphingobacterium sp. LRF_L2]|uniref:DUF5683 domain-containing protein n=1 Tax=Sphingobacterium sp. LRF_L2 TaxID=3369421 RepID=UPI003F60E9AD
MRHFLTLFLFFSSLFLLQAQEQKVATDSLQSKLQVADSIARAVQDTVKKETREERKARERAEKERAKYYYKDIKKDSARLEIEHLSDVAWKRSLMLPGWGQYTNKGLWWIKVPIIYGGLATGYFVFDYWQWYYKKFLDELEYRISVNDSDKLDPDLLNFSTTGLVTYKDYGRRNRDLTILITAGWWGLNVIEAYVDSMLKNRWNIGRDMTMKVSPTFLPSTGYASSNVLSGYRITPGIKLTMNIN